MTNDDATRIKNEIREATEAFKAAVEAFKAAVEALEQADDPDDYINVGDEVEYGRMVYVVTKITGDESHILVIHTSGDVGAIPIDECHKTGRHFPEIAEVLKKMEAEE